MQPRDMRVARRRAAQNCLKMSGLNQPRVAARIEVQDLTGPYLPVLGWPVGITAAQLGGAAAGQRSSETGLGFSASSGVLVGPGASLRGTAYDLVGEVPVDDGRLKDAVPNLTGAAGRDTRLPPGLPPELDAEARRLTAQASLGRVLVKLGLVLVSMLAAIGALMRPQVRGETETVTSLQASADVMFVLDTSRSMRVPSSPTHSISVGVGEAPLPSGVSFQRQAALALTISSARVRALPTSSSRGALFAPSTRRRRRPPWQSRTRPFPSG